MRTVFEIFENSDSKLQFAVDRKSGWILIESASDGSRVTARKASLSHWKNVDTILQEIAGTDIMLKRLETRIKKGGKWIIEE